MRKMFLLCAAFVLAVFTAGTAMAASLSGKVVVYCPSPAALADKLAADFTRKTGVAVEMFQGTTGEILARLEAEKANPMADVVIMASWPDGLRMQQDDLLLSYVPANADKMAPGWINPEKTIYGTSASAVGVIYNTRQVQTLSADWDELARPEYKDQIAIPDPLKSGSCKDFLSGYLTALGEGAWKTWEDLAANGMTIPGANKAALDAVITGEKAILIAGVDYNAYEGMAKGEPVAIYYPASGTVVNPRPAMILKSAQNRANAEAYMDYLISDDAQRLVAEAYLLPGRADIPATGRATLNEIPQLAADWAKMMASAEAMAQKLIDLCGK